MAKINCDFSEQLKKLNQVTDTNCVKRTLGHSWITRNWYAFNEQRSWYLQLKKRGVVGMEKKIWKSLLDEKYLLGKPVHFSVENTVNNVDTWGFIRQFFQHLYRTANSIVHLVVWIETAQILRYRQQYISPGRIQHSGVVLEHLMVKVKTVQIR